MDISAEKNSLDPAQDIFQQGVALHKAGHLDGAIAKYKKCIAIQPKNITFIFHLGLALHYQNKFDDAISSYQKIIEIKSDVAEVYSSLATAFKDLGRFDEAYSNWHKAIAVNPTFAAAHFDIGNTLREQGKIELAVASYQKAIAIKPDYVEAYCNLGISLKELKRVTEGVAVLQKTVAMKPDFAEAHCNLGYALIEQNRLNEAVASLQTAIALKPDLAQAFFNLGNAAKGLGKIDSAITYFKKAITINLNYCEAYNSLGLIFNDAGNYTEAILNFQKAIAIKPDYIFPYYFLGFIFKEQGQIDAAVATYQKALTIKGNVGLEITLALTQTPIQPSESAILNFREKLLQEITRLKKQNSNASDPYLTVGTSNFYTAYHALNDIIIQKQLAGLYLHTYPMLNWSANFNPSPQKPHAKLKIGILSTHLYNHTIGSLNLGIIEHLNRDKFEVIIFRPKGKHDDFSQRIDLAADNVIHINKDLQEAREIIAAQNIAVLYYPDIGMCSFTYFMAFYRLAPVQCTTLGHPVTTGIPNIDYFISSQSLEPAEAKEHYTEQLYLMEGLPCYYLRAKPLAKKASRIDYGLPLTGNIYLCPQSLFKIHPDFDATIMEILHLDPTGWLVLIEGANSNLTTLLKERWSKLSVNNSEQIIFLPRMHEEKFTALFGVADVVLDTFHFSGGKTTSEALALGAPVITLPGSFMRGRITLACYKLMGVMDLVAQTPKEYIYLAHRLVSDPLWRSEIVNKIKANSHIIMENRDTVREFEKFFAYAVEKSSYK
ncbi:MAG: tetratricopeptide repeat protein [Magnetococcales bacterium]|nr:tetratricopeptide repeat protein [Magnetococcales bacterium]